MNLILVKPHITEKGTLLKEKNQYVFSVERRAAKTEIKKAIENLYKVKVEKVMTLKKPAKKIFTKNKEGLKPGFKKAVVKLKKGQKIEL